MAISKRASRGKKDHGLVRWRVTWRTGGGRDGEPDGETCDSKEMAKHFEARVRLAGWQRPPGYPPGCRGLRMADPGPLEEEDPEDAAPGGVAHGISGAAATPVVTPPVVRAPAFAEVWEEYLAQNDDMEDGHRRTCRREFTQHVSHAVVTLPDGTRVGPRGRRTARSSAVRDRSHHGCL